MYSALLGQLLDKIGANFVLQHQVTLLENSIALILGILSSTLRRFFRSKSNLSTHPFSMQN